MNKRTTIQLCYVNFSNPWLKSESQYSTNAIKEYMRKWHFFSSPKRNHAKFDSQPFQDFQNPASLAERAVPFVERDLLFGAAYKHVCL